MVIHPAVHTLAEAGFKLNPCLGIDPNWVIVGQWDTSRLGETINATIQLAQIIASFGARRCAEVSYGTYRIIAAEEADDIAVLIAEQHDRYEDERMIDDATYWDQLAPYVENHWADLAIPDRIVAVQRFGSEPTQVFAETVPPELFSELAAVVEDR